MKDASANECAEDDAEVVDENEEVGLSLFEQEERDYLEILLLSSKDKDRPLLLPLILRQYNSHDPRWGIYSSVWDGGLALAAYLLQVSAFKNENEAGEGGLEVEVDDDFWNRTIVIDLGSGTGLAGLACAALSGGRAAVHLTDLPEATPLLQVNVNGNADHWKYGKHPQTPLVQTLVWGESISNDWIAEIVSQTKVVGDGPRRNRILVLGADIVYRMSLFGPLLSTLSELHSKLVQQQPELNFECLLACSSTRTHLNAFYKTAHQNGFSLEYKASVQLPPNSLRLDEATVTNAEDRNMSPEDAPVGSGLVTIVQLNKLSCTFSI